MGKPTAKKVSGCGWWMPAVTTPFGPLPLDGPRQDSPYKARKEAERILHRLRTSITAPSEMNSEQNSA